MKIILDYMNIVHVSFSIAKSESIKEKGSFIEEDVGLFYHKLLDSLINISKTYGNVIYANEGKGSLEWRRSIFPGYKANRKHDEYYQILKNELPKIREIFTWFPCKVINVDGAEGDDIIRSLAEYFADSGEDVTIISSDRDMVQLINYNQEKIKVYNPISKQYREPQPDIIIKKAIVGDSSDGIPGISRVGEKTYEKMMNDKKLFEEKIRGHEAELESYKKIIDLSKAPSYIKEEAITKFNETDYYIFEPQSIELFMIENALNEQLSRWNNNVGDINMALYQYSDNFGDSNNKEVETADLNEIEDMLKFINSL